jgi:hypothetical protein
MKHNETQSFEGTFGVLLQNKCFNQLDPISTSGFYTWGLNKWVLLFYSEEEKSFCVLNIDCCLFFNTGKTSDEGKLYEVNDFKCYILSL